MTLNTLSNATGVGECGALSPHALAMAVLTAAGIEVVSHLPLKRAFYLAETESGKWFAFISSLHAPRHSEILGALALHGPLGSRKKKGKAPTPPPPDG